VRDPNLTIELVDDHVHLTLIAVPPLVARALDEGVFACFLPRPVCLARASWSPVDSRRCNVSGSWLGKQGVYFDDVVGVSDNPNCISPSRVVCLGCHPITLCPPRSSSTGDAPHHHSGLDVLELPLHRLALDQVPIHRALLAREAQGKPRARDVGRILVHVGTGRGGTCCLGVRLGWEEDLHPRQALLVLESDKDLPMPVPPLPLF